MTALARLLAISGPALEGGTVSGEAENPVARGHLRLLGERNGFMAFESALLVRPVGGPLDVLAWNSAEGWRRDYGALAEGLFFFAEDVFGGQFAIASDQVVTFDPETGEREFLAPDIEAWGAAILADHEYLTGHPVAHAWQAEHSALRAGERLLPRQPLVSDGEFTIENMKLVTDRTRMRLGAQLASHIATLSDGERFRLPYDPDQSGLDR